MCETDFSYGGKVQSIIFLEIVKCFWILINMHSQERGDTLKIICNIFLVVHGNTTLIT